MYRSFMIVHIKRALPWSGGSILGCCVLGPEFKSAEIFLRSWKFFYPVLVVKYVISICFQMCWLSIRRRHTLIAPLPMNVVSVGIRAGKVRSIWCATIWRRNMASSLTWYVKWHLDILGFKLRMWMVLTGWPLRLGDVDDALNMQFTYLNNSCSNKFRWNCHQMNTTRPHLRISQHWFR